MGRGTCGRAGGPRSGALLCGPQTLRRRASRCAGAGRRGPGRGGAVTGSVAGGEHLEDVEEEVDDVDVELDGGQHVVVRAQPVRQLPARRPVMGRRRRSGRGRAARWGYTPLRAEASVDSDASGWAAS